LTLIQQAERPARNGRPNPSRSSSSRANTQRTVGLPVDLRFHPRELSNDQDRDDINRCERGGWNNFERDSPATQTGFAGEAVDLDRPRGDDARASTRD
jgi:hypothetical protein